MSSASSQPIAVRHIEALTTLRFFAAFLVLLFHHGQSLVAWAPRWCQTIVQGGYVGVPFFFVLSGFILAYNYLPATHAGTFEARRFWLARFARVYPIYAIALLVAAPFFLTALWQHTPGEGALARFGLQAVLSFGLGQAWIPDWAFAWNGPAWSLSVEAFFYLTFPFLVGQMGTRGRWNLLAGLAVAAGCLVVASRLLGGNLISTVQQLLGWANPLLWLPLFLLGIGIGDQHLRGALPRALRNGSKHPVWAVLLTLGVLALIIWAMGSSLQRRSQLLFCYAVTAPCAVLILLLADEANPVSRLLRWRGLVLMGEASYSLYILHRPIHDWFLWMEKAWGWLGTSTTSGCILYVFTCLALSVLALIWIEHPCRDWIKRGWRRPETLELAAGTLPGQPKPTLSR